MYFWVFLVKRKEINRHHPGGPKIERFLLGSKHLTDGHFCNDNSTAEIRVSFLDFEEKKEELKANQPGMQKIKKCFGLNNFPDGHFYNKKSTVEIGV